MLMLKENCLFTSKPLVELYKTLCSLEAPYLWVESREGEELYYIDDIKTFDGVLSHYWNNSGWELPGSCDDIIELHLTRIINDKKCEIERKVVFDRTNQNVEITDDELMKKAGIRIPTKQELADAEYADGIPGHISSNEEKSSKLKAEVEAYEKEIMSLSLKNETYADILRELTYKIEMKIEVNDRKINYMKKCKNDSLLEINKLI
jgi:hypothetical protein